MQVFRGVKFVVERHSDGYIAYPLGVRGVCVGEGNTRDEALEDAKSAFREFVEVFGKEYLEESPPAAETIRYGIPRFFRKHDTHRWT